MITVPPQYVDGIHTREIMREEDFPLKIEILRTGQIWNVHSFVKNGMAYTYVDVKNCVPLRGEGIYFGKIGKDFRFV